MSGALAISAGVHGVALFALLLVARFSWPAPPIAIEVVPHVVHAHVRVGPPRPIAPPASESAPQPPGASAHPKPRPRPQASAPVPSDLQPLAPEADNLVVVLRIDRLRKSPHAQAALALIAALPDYQNLIGSSGLSLYDDFQALLIATPDPRDVTATFLAARYRDSPRIRALAGRSLGPGDPRVFRFLRPGLAVLTRPEDAARLDTALKSGKDDPARKWLGELEKLDQVGGDAGPALLVTLADVPALIRFGQDLPTPLGLGLAVSGDGSPELRIKAVFKDEADAARMQAKWPEVMGRYRSLTALLGLSGALDGMKLERHGATIEVAGRVPQKDLALGLSYARALLPEAPATVDDRPPPR